MNTSTITSNKPQLTSLHKPVSIETKSIELTKGEEALLLLMKQKLESSQMIVYNEVHDLYINHVRTRKGEGGEHFMDTSDSRARNWFRRALGNLIIKAKLIAIPIIDI